MKRSRESNTSSDSESVTIAHKRTKSIDEETKKQIDDELATEAKAEAEDPANKPEILLEESLANEEAGSFTSQLSKPEDNKSANTEESNGKEDTKEEAKSSKDDTDAIEELKDVSKRTEEVDEEGKKETRDQEGEQTKLDTETATAESTPVKPNDKSQTTITDGLGASKPVFGSNFSFGSSFGTPATGGSVFGSGFSNFSNSTVSKSENPWADPEEDNAKSKEDADNDNEGENDEDNDKEKENDTTFVAIDKPLQQQAVKTGEEDEEGIYSCRAKLYVLDLEDTKSGWKERGVGNLHVNTTKTDGKSRLVMRAEGVLKVIINVWLKDCEVFEGMQSSLSSDKFVRLTAVEGGKPCQFAFRTGNKQVASELFKSISEGIKKYS